MSTIGDTYEVRLHQDLNSQAILNVFHYQDSGVAGTALNLATVFGSTVIPSLATVQCSSLTITGIDVENLNDLSDFGTFPGGSLGGVTGDYLPPFMAWTFIYGRATRLIRNGSKRIAGVSESQQANGVATSGALSFLSAVAATLQGNLTGAGGRVYTPVILHRQPSLIPTFVPYNIASVSYSHIGTQNSRKP